MALKVATINSLQTHLEVGRDVLAQEAAALSSLQESLGESFVQAISLLAQTRARIVVSGMGKSGHIARKIAATLSSTGQPSLFVHPAEASHGDLGMITADDAVLLLSKSGETSEMTTLLHYTRRFSMPLVAITANPQSTLAQSSDACLLLPKTAEACPMGLAPTTSTVMMLALGDAIAIALLVNRGFSNQDFHRFHPGGNLGTQLKRVTHIMHTGESLPLGKLQDPMSDILLTMTAKGFGCVGITDDDNRLIGVITDGDLRRHMVPNLLALKASEVMTAKPKTVDSAMLMGEALAFMNEKMVTSLFVVDSTSHVLGVIHIHDFIRTGVV
ncbi:MAG: KpsF/GutQ family sugar-phosphate isomerase [Alphaproteobacteria bacterium]